jgi:hypothetical protein
MEELEADLRWHKTILAQDASERLYRKLHPREPFRPQLERGNFKRGQWQSYR